MIMGEMNELNDDAWEEKDPNDAPLPKADADAGPKVTIAAVAAVVANRTWFRATTASRRRSTS